MSEPCSSSSKPPSPEAGRYSYARAILGNDTFEKINSAHVLVVGAGGIGCELLKNLVLSGFGNIEIIDLDTIDLSNLNRQFLFQKQHIKKPKSIVAKETASSFNPLVNIVAHHANIKEPQFGVSYFQKFDIVMNALDNLDTRRWVNKMCVAANVPLLESGTTGFLGQVQPIKKDLTECYDCTEKPTPKSYPVCTIRSTPSTPIHCIVWAKSWLFVQLLGADDETEDAELDKALADGENAQEVDALRKEASEMRDIRASLFEAAKSQDNQKLQQAAKLVFDKVYQKDIQRLLSMEEMWTHRPTKPVPLEYDDAKVVQENGDPTSTETASSNGNNKADLKDQRSLTLAENVAMLTSSLSALASRAAADPTNPLSFDKDDDDALDFVTASSNLRSHVYQIEQKTRFQVKEMAGNIIPAIASTNAIISGMLVIQSLHILRNQWDKARFVSLSRGNQRMLTSFNTGKPNPNCGVCRDLYLPVSLPVETITLTKIIDQVRQYLGLSDDIELATYEGTRLLSDPDFEDNLEKSLSSLGVHNGTLLTLTDEEGIYQAIQLPITNDSTLQFHWSSLLPPQLEKKLLPRSLQSDSSIKDDEDDDDGIVLIENTPPPPPAAAAATSSVLTPPPSSSTPSSPIKKRSLPQQDSLSETESSRQPKKLKVSGSDPDSAIQIE